MRLPTVKVGASLPATVSCHASPCHASHKRMGIPLFHYMGTNRVESLGGVHAVHATVGPIQPGLQVTRVAPEEIRRPTTEEACRT